MNCVHCGQPASAGRAEKCHICFLLIWSLQRRAGGAVNSAIRKGEMPRASSLRCVDCGEPAFCYDHRDYLDPLKVEPVCRSCNALRGPAIQCSGGQIAYLDVFRPQPAVFR